MFASGEFWAAIIVAILSGGLVREVFISIRDKVRGRTARRSELERAWDKADNESRRRRLAEDYAFTLRKILIESPCIEAHEVPPYPPYNDTKETNNE